MTEKPYRLNKWGTKLLKNNRPLFDWANEGDNIVDVLNKLYDENKKLKLEKQELDYWKKRALLLENKYGEGDSIKWLRENTVWEQMPSSHVPKTSLRPKPTKKCGMTEDKSCGTCKYFQLDGMFGIWCDLGKDWKNVKYCSDWER